jgi:hypothetical protein
MFTGTLFRESLGKSVVEVVLIVIGVLTALWVDEWRSDLEEKQAVRQHLAGIVQEMDANRWTAHRRSRDGYMLAQIEALETVIRILGQPEPAIEDPDTFIRTLLVSSQVPSPWFNRNNFDSFKASGHFQSVYNQEFAHVISDAYEAINVLFTQRFDYRDDYKDAVVRLVPTRYQSENNEMRTYTPGRFSAPVIEDDMPAERAIEGIVEHRGELLELARYKAERLTAKWYATTRIILVFQNARETIVASPLMRDVDIPVSDLHEDLEAWKL